MTLYEEYISCRENFEQKLLIFDEQTRAKIKRKMANERNRTTFFSKITEIDFGLFYAENGAVVEYEKRYKFHNKEKDPDWTIDFNGQKFICEVLRLNPTQIDQFRDNFDKRLSDHIIKIKGSYIIEVFYISKDFQESAFKINDIINELEPWLLTKRSLSDQITILNNFKFKIIAIDTEFVNIKLVGNFNLISVDPRRLESNRSEFYKKVIENADLIENTNLPFIINLYTPLESGIDEIHLYDYLYGASVEDRINNSAYTLLDKGLFYNDEKAKKYLSGVLFRRGDKVTFFYNYNVANKLNSANIDLFKSFQYIF